MECTPYSGSNGIKKPSVGMSVNTQQKVAQNMTNDGHVSCVQIFQLSPISDCIIHADVQGSKHYWGAQELHEFNLQQQYGTSSKHGIVSNGTAYFKVLLLLL